MKGKRDSKVRKEVWLEPEVLVLLEEMADEDDRSLKSMMETLLRNSVKGRVQGRVSDTAGEMSIEDLGKDMVKGKITSLWEEVRDELHSK